MPHLPSLFRLRLKRPMVNKTSKIKSNKPLLFLPLMIPCFLLFSCSATTETIVVEERAKIWELEEEEEELSVKKIPLFRIGDTGTVRSMDPLFARTPAAQRVASITYEGLVRLNEKDEVIPAIAERWDVSEDSLTYTFFLREGLFFHDDQSFIQGRGRRINSRDVVRVFERMASKEVPEDAAQLFMRNIQGFEAFYQGKRNRYLEEGQEVTRIEGIRAPDEFTVIFELKAKEPEFLQKLAHTHALIYPREPLQFRENGLHRHPVGTGPFRFHASREENHFIFLENSYYYEETTSGHRLPLVQRVEWHLLPDTDTLHEHLIEGRLEMAILYGLPPDTLLKAPELHQEDSFLNQFQYIESPDNGSLSLLLNRKFSGAKVNQQKGWIDIRRLQKRDFEK